MIRTIHSAIEEKLEVKNDETHSVWPWILLSRFEVGRDGKTSYERLERKLPKEQGHSLAVGISWKRRRAGGPLGKLTCMWEDGVHWDTKATSGEVIVRNRNGVSAHRKIQKKTARQGWDPSNLEMIVAVPWRKNEDDAKMDGEGLKGELVMMDKDHKEKLEMEERVPLPKRVYITREGLEVF